MESEMDTDLTGCDVGNHLGDKEWAELRAFVVVLSIVHHLVLESLDTANADAIDDTHAVLVHCIEIHLRIGHGLHGCYHTELCAAIHLTGILAVNEVVGLEALDLARKLCPELRRIKKCNRSCATLAGKDVLPCLINSES